MRDFDCFNTTEACTVCLAVPRRYVVAMASPRVRPAVVYEGPRATFELDEVASHDPRMHATVRRWRTVKADHIPQHKY